jgi:hypothetical protein
MVWILAIAFAVFFGFIAICYFVPRIVISHRYYALDIKERAELEDAYRKTVAQIFGGAALAFTFAWTWVKDNQTLDISRTQAANQQFAEAAKLLGPKNTDPSAAAIYSFENVVKTRDEYAQPVVRTLRAYVIERRPASMKEGDRPTRIKQDVQAAIYVLARLPATPGSRHFVDMYLAGADLAEMNLNGADFRGATLYAANFSKAKLTDAQFSGGSFAEWESYGHSAWTESTPTTEQWKEWEKYRYIVNFEATDLTNATFKEVSVAGAKFDGATLNGARFVDSEISRATFEGARGITESTFSNACYEGKAPAGLPDRIVAPMRKTCK